MIEIRNISKTFRIPIRNSGLLSAFKALFKREYRYVEAVSDLNIEITEGSMVGYIGPNGAGKSTSIKILSGILHPDKGSVLINGIDPFKNRKRHAQQIGVVFGQRTQLWWDLPVGDSFELLSQMYKIPRAAYETRLKDFIEMFELENVIKSPVRQLSLGQRVRCDIVASLLHNPKVLFLDEPTIGLDVHSKRLVRDLIKQVNKKYHTTVILTTHDMQDIEEIVDRIILIGKGKILYDGSLDSLKSTYQNDISLCLNYRGEFNDIGDSVIIDQAEGYVQLTLKSDLASVISLLQSQVNINDLEILYPKIDDIILKLYEDYNL